MLTNRVFALDGPVSSGTGVTTGIEQFLQRIAGVFGPTLTTQSAGNTPLLHPHALCCERIEWDFPQRATAGQLSPPP
jgi:hypothetical protein